MDAGHRPMAAARIDSVSWQGQIQGKNPLTRMRLLPAGVQGFRTRVPSASAAIAACSQCIGCRSLTTHDSAMSM